MSATQDNLESRNDIFISFILPLGAGIRLDNCGEHYKAMTSPVLIDGAEKMIEDVGSIHKYYDAIIEALINIFASTMITLGYHEPGSAEGYVESTTEYTIRETLPSKDCYKFINLLMTIYVIYHNKSLPEKVCSVVEKWLLDNEPTVKSAGKN